VTRRSLTSLKRTSHAKKTLVEKFGGNQTLFCLHPVRNFRFLWIHSGTLCLCCKCKRHLVSVIYSICISRIASKKILSWNSGVVSFLRYHFSETGPSVINLRESSLKNFRINFMWHFLHNFVFFTFRFLRKNFENIKRRTGVWSLRQSGLVELWKTIFYFDYVWKALSKFSFHEKVHHLELPFFVNFQSVKFSAEKYLAWITQCMVST
jgi:hypothetical protein